MKAQCFWKGEPHGQHSSSSEAPAQLSNFLLQDPRVQEKEAPPPLSQGLWQSSRPSTPLTRALQEVLGWVSQGARREGGLGEGEAPAGSPPSQARCVCTRENGETWEGAGMTQGSRKSRRGGACVYFSGLFMNVCLCGGSVSVNGCRCDTVNERLLSLRELRMGSRMELGSGRRRRVCVCACEHACVSVCEGWARSGPGHVRHHGNVRGARARSGSSAGGVSGAAGSATSQAGRSAGSWGAG